MSEGNEAPKPSIKDFLKTKSDEVSKKQQEQQQQKQQEKEQQEQQEKVDKMEDFMVEVDEKKDKMEDFMVEVDEKRKEIGVIKEQQSILTEQSSGLSESLSTIKDKVADYKQKRDVLEKAFQESLNDEELITYFKENNIESWRDFLDKVDTEDVDNFKKSQEEVSKAAKDRKEKEDELREKHDFGSDVSGKKLEDKIKEKEVVLKNQTDVLKMETPEGVQERKEELTEEINQKMEEVYKENYYVKDIEKTNTDYTNFSQSSFLNNLTSSEIQGPELDLLLKLNGKTETEMWSDFYKDKVEDLVDKLYRKEFSQKDIDYLNKNGKFNYYSSEYYQKLNGIRIFPVENKNVFFDFQQAQKEFLQRTGGEAIINEDALKDLGEKLKDYEDEYKQLRDLLKNSLEDSLGKDIWEKENGGLLASNRIIDVNSVARVVYSPERVLDYLQINGYAENRLRETIKDPEEREKIINLLSKVKKAKQSFYNFNLTSCFLPENNPLVSFVKKNNGIGFAIGNMERMEASKKEYKRKLTESVLTRVSAEVARTEENKMREENKDLLAKREEAEKKMTEMKNGFAQIEKYNGLYGEGNPFYFKLELVDGNFILNNQNIPESEKAINRDEEVVAEMKKEADEVLKKTLPILGLSKANQEKAQKIAKDIDSREGVIKSNKEWLKKNIDYKDNALKTVNKFISELNLTEEEMEKAKDQNPIEFLYGILNDRLEKNKATEEESKILKSIADLKSKRSKVFSS